MMQEAAVRLTVSIWRGKETGRYQTYTVPRLASQTVLDVVSYVQRELEPALAYRFACRVGMCGSCAMTVNGTPRWTCRTHVGRVASNGRLSIGPLANLPVIKDLATDMTSFFERWQEAKGVFKPSRTRADGLARIGPRTAGRRAVDAAIECINCGVCHAACDTVALNADYLGPGPLNRAWTLVNDERDAGNKGRLTALAGEGGCHACHTHTSCASLCPKALDPTASIAGLKRAVVEAYFKGELE
jgi:fumarate reductase iron-sulfur subunit